MVTGNSQHFIPWCLKRSKQIKVQYNNNNNNNNMEYLSCALPQRIEAHYNINKTTWNNKYITLGDTIITEMQKPIIQAVIQNNTLKRSFNYRSEGVGGSNSMLQLLSKDPSLSHQPTTHLTFILCHVIECSLVRRKVFIELLTIWVQYQRSEVYLVNNKDAFTINQSLRSDDTL